MWRILCFGLIWLMIINLLPAAMAAEDVTSQVTSMPAGAKIEIRLKTGQKLVGFRRDVSESGFTLADSQAVTRQIAFDVVASVRQVRARPLHVRRYVLIFVGVGAAVTATIFGVAYYEFKKCGPFGCNAKGLL